MLNHISTIRSDIQPVLNDISEKACDYAFREYGIRSYACPCYALPESVGQFDVVLVVDSLYYEPNLQLFGTALSQLVRPSGSLIIRVPNKIRLIKLRQMIYRLLNRNHRTQNRIKFLNPEHLYVFSPTFLKAYLTSQGFVQIQFHPSVMLCSNSLSRDIFLKIFFIIARLVYRISAKQIIITPAMLITAVKKSVDAKYS